MKRLGLAILGIWLVCFPLYGQNAVVAPEPIAARLGMQILEQGGNAVDAAVAIGFALAVTYPQAGNIGGGGFAMVYRPGNEPVALDFRETAPWAAGKDMYLDKKGQVIPGASTLSARSAGVPGTVRGMRELWRCYGHLPWAKLLEPAIKLAKRGHRISLYQHRAILRHLKKLSADADSRRVFCPYGNALAPNAIWHQLALSKTLNRIASHGDREFYRGQTARDFVKELKKKGGIITLSDLENYRAVWRTPVHVAFNGDDLYLMPLPSSGGIVIGEILGMLGNFNYHKLKPDNAETIHLLAEMEKRAYADRNTYLGGPDCFPVYWQRLLAPAYLKKRAREIHLDHATPSSQVLSGLGPVGKSGLMLKESPQTTSYAVMDANGNCVSITYTLNGSFGNGILLKNTGILLNNEMDDFSAKPGSPNLYGLVGGISNAIEPGKRMLSSMTPTIVLRNGRFRMALGSPGGSTIITTVLQTYLNLSLFSMDTTQAMNAPRFHHQWLPDEIRLEPELWKNQKLVEKLKELGQNPHKARGLGNAVIIFQSSNGKVEAVADPRGSGIALSR
ncbi:MAG: gamma-glutamyltransferase [Acidobacteria bacterium]|nr:MAG: gamma-glutamyltransferase [Acidobacteriota bacterium]RLE23038.1 MAG: gamma-glutamyltransferase [Acidobacteriota bacterium]